MKEYYDTRAPEYDDWWRNVGLYVNRHKPGWKAAVTDLCAAVAALPPAHTLDVACGTGFLTRHLRGEVVGLDQSKRMLALAREQAPTATFVHGDGLALPVADAAFDRVFTSYFYCHLEEAERQLFLAEARRVAPELVVAGSVLQPDVEPERWEERVLKDGTRWTVFKRYFDPEQLAAELGGGEVLHSDRWFVMVRRRETQVRA